MFNLVSAPTSADTVCTESQVPTNYVHKSNRTPSSSLPTPQFALRYQSCIKQRGSSLLFLPQQPATRYYSCVHTLYLQNEKYAIQDARKRWIFALIAMLKWAHPAPRTPPQLKGRRTGQKESSQAPRLPAGLKKRDCHL